MKRLYFIAATLLCSLAIIAQEYKVEGNEVVFTKVIENTGKSVSETHDALEAFFALRYNDVNSTQRLNQPDHLIYKGIFSELYTYTMGMWVNDVPHTVDVAIKNNRIRIKISVVECVCHSTQNLNKYTYPIAECSPIGNNNNNRNVLKSTAVKTFEALCQRIDALFADIENSLDKSETEEDW